MRLATLGLIFMFATLAGAAFAVSSLGIAYEINEGNTVLGVFAGILGFGGGFAFLKMAIEEIKGL